MKAIIDIEIVKCNFCKEKYDKNNYTHIEYYVKGKKKTFCSLSCLLKSKNILWSVKYK